MSSMRHRFVVVFFFSLPPTADIYTLSLHDALPICRNCRALSQSRSSSWPQSLRPLAAGLRRTSSHRDCHSSACDRRSEEHTSELQSLTNLVCRLLLEKKNEFLSTDCRGGNVNVEIH